MTPRVLPLLFLLAFPILVSAQDQETIDSLTHVAKKNPPDTSSVRAYLELSDATLNSDYDKSMSYAQSGLAIARLLKDDSWSGRCYYQMGTACFSYGLSMEAVDHFTDAVAVLEKKDSAGYWVAKSMNGMGNAQRRLGRLKEATDSYLEAKRIFEKIGDRKGVAGTYNNLGIILMAEGQQENALDYFKIARQMNIEINNQSWLAKNLSNMGTAFFNLQEYDSAEVYFRQAFGIYLAVGDMNGWATDLINLGNVYTLKKEYAKAKEQFDLALDYDRRNGREADMAFALLNMGGLYTETGDYRTAEKYLDSSMVISTKYNDLQTLIEVYKGYTVMYEKSGDFKNAYKYYSLYATKKDSISSSDMKNQMDQMEESLREEKLREQNASLEQSKMLQDVQLNRSHIISYTAFGGIALVLLLAFALFKRYQLKKKANDLLKERNREIQSQKTIIEEKNRDISDSINYAKKIQDTVLPDISAFHSALGESFVYYRPRNVVSGDFYWFHKAGNKTFVAVADCTGHGVPGAFMSMIGIDKMNQAVLEPGTLDPSVILTTVNRQLKTVLKQDDLSGGMRDGMDVALISIDRGKMTLEFSGANRPVWITREGSLIELDPLKVSVGGHTPASQEFPLQEFALQKNDCIYLFSDGYADQFGGPKEKKMMTRNFRQVLLSFSNEPMETQKKILSEKFDAWKGSLEQVDDVCVAGIRV
ncbi:MAG TPA: tetratricopeptide repeat protein [Bacteroidia bacterium]|nr:tetratricopeptide repeat protein [Bacteroidia bacterium]